MNIGGIEKIWMMNKKYERINFFKFVHQIIINTERQLIFFLKFSLKLKFGSKGKNHFLVNFVRYAIDLVLHSCFTVERSTVFCVKNSFRGKNVCLP